MKNAVKVTGNNEGLFTPKGYAELRLQLSTGDFHTHRATRIKVPNATKLITQHDLIDGAEVRYCQECGRLEIK